MAKKRKPFRFWIPWFSEASASRPVTRPKDESKSRERADTTIPIQGRPGKAPAQFPPTQAQEVPIVDPQQHSPSHSLEPEKSFSVTIGSPRPSPSKPESLASMSSIPTSKTQLTSQPRSPAHSALERTSEESRPTAIESTILATSPSQQEKEKMVVSEGEPQPEMSPLKAIPISQELAQPKISPHVSEPMPHPKESPFKTIPKSQDLTQPETSSHVSELVPQTKTSSYVSEPMPQPKESPLKTIAKSQEIIQPEISAHVLEPVPQPKKSPLKTISEPQEPIQPKASSQPKRMSSKATGMSSEEEGSTTPPKTPPTTKKFELDSKGGNSKAVLETQSKFHQNEENEKVVHELTQEGKAEDPTTGRTKAKLHTKASTLGTQTKDPFSRVVRAEREKQETQESIESKVMSAASNSTGKDIKVVSSIDPATKSVSSTSHQKDVLYNGEKTPLKKGIKEDISKFVQKLATGQPTDTMEDKPVSAITLAGENRGATMQIDSESTKKGESVHIHRAYRTDPEESPEVTTESEGEEGSNNSVEPDEVGRAYVNSNMQSINNSLMYRGSITENDPGVQLILPRKPAQSVKCEDEDLKG